MPAHPSPVVNSTKIDGCVPVHKFSRNGAKPAKISRAVLDRKLRTKIIELTGWINDCLDMIGIDYIRADSDKTIRRLIDPSDDDKTVEVQAGTPLHQTAIYTAMHVMAEILSDPTTRPEEAKAAHMIPKYARRLRNPKKGDRLKNVILFAVAQSGKSQTTMICEKIIPVIFKLLGMGIGAVQTVIGSKKSHSSQYRHEQGGLSQILDNIVIRHTGNNEEHCFLDVFSKIDGRLKRDATSALIERKKEYNHNSVGYGIGPITTVAGRNVERINGRFEHFSNCLDYIITFIDECDERSEQGSIMHRMLSGMKRNNDDKQLFNMLSHPKSSLILQSASNFDGDALYHQVKKSPFNPGGWGLVDGWLGKGYYGFHFTCGRYQNWLEDYTVQMPDIRSMDTEFDIKTKFVQMGAFGSKRKFDALCDKIPKKEEAEFEKICSWDWQKYREYILDKISDMIYKTLFDHKYTPDHARREGFSIRAMPIEVNDDLRACLEKWFSKKYPDCKVRFESHHSENTLPSSTNNECSTDQTFEEAINRIKRLHPGYKYVLIVVSTARRGDWFPPACSEFAEFGYGAYASADVQGMAMGRPLGYNKYSRIYVTERTKKFVNRYIDSLGEPRVKPHSRHVVNEMTQKRIYVSCYAEQIVSLLKESPDNRDYQRAKAFFDLIDRNTDSLIRDEGPNFKGSPENSWSLLREVEKFICLVEKCNEFSYDRHDTPLQLLHYHPSLLMGDGITDNTFDNMCNDDKQEICALIAKARANEYDEKVARYVTQRDEVKKREPYRPTIARRTLNPELSTHKTAQRNVLTKSKARSYATHSGFYRNQVAFEIDWKKRKVKAVHLMLSKTAWALTRGAEPTLYQSIYEDMVEDAFVEDEE